MVGGDTIVYCTECGTNNVDGATVCVSCGAPLYGGRGKGRVYVRYGRYEGASGFSGRGGAIMWIFIGLIIFFAGFSLLAAEIFGLDIPWGPIILILAGVFILVRFFQVRNRRR
ncbi:zinc ribbon domain-containing protein [Candidatus Bathyarchaeota archaeon]|nr:zinc ribbon domain-containing protein [Candidatus Bathyarchaeota archaeon]